MTLFEGLVVIAVLAVLAAIILPNSGYHTHIRRINCVNNLHQIGLAYRSWEGDNNDKYPMGVSVAFGGSMEMVVTGDVTHTFLAMSNELSTPKILHCPDDLAHTELSSFTGLAGSNISYFVGVDVTNDMNPQMIIAGDANFEISGIAVKSGLAQFTTNSNVAWAPGRHVPYKEHFWTPTRGIFLGNIGLADGSVQEASTYGLQAALRLTGVATNRFAIP